MNQGDTSEARKGGGRVESSRGSRRPKLFAVWFGLLFSPLLPISNESETRTQIKVDGEKIGGGGRERVKAVGALTFRPPKDNFKAQTQDLLLVQSGHFGA